ncbi:hypothetical protein MHYP_G00031700 [Metynnis hypsauchen]
MQLRVQKNGPRELPPRSVDKRSVGLMWRITAPACTGGVSRDAAGLLSAAFQTKAAAACFLKFVVELFCNSRKLIFSVMLISCGFAALALQLLW